MGILSRFSRPSVVFPRWWRPGREHGVPLDGSAGRKPEEPETLTLVAPIPDNVPERPAVHSRYGRPSMVWTYRDAEARPLFHVYRFDPPVGKKQVLPMTLWRDAKDILVWRFKGSPEPRPLYGLDRLAKIPPAYPVIVSEGEKAADAAQRLVPAAVSMTWPGGCKATGKTDFTPLAGHRVTIFPDADKPGFEAALDVASRAKLAGAAEVVIVPPPGDVMPGWDLADAEAEGWDEKRVVSHIQARRLDVNAFADLARERYCIEHKAEAPEPGRPSAEGENYAPVHFDEAMPPPIKPEIIPGILRTYPQALAEAIQVPFELAFINAVGSVAVAAQGKLCVSVKPGYAEPLNIYALCPLPPGERKSATVEACKRPLVEWQKVKRLEIDDDIRDAESERKTLEKAIEAKRAKAAQAANAEVRREIIEEIKAMERELPEVPIAPRFLADDFTPEALAVLMEKHDERIGLLEAEGGIFDTLAGKYSNGIPNFDIILKGWCGEPSQIDRKGRDSIFLQHPLLTMVISPQPGIVQGLSSRSGFRDRGLIGRFLYVMPQSRLGGRSIETKPVPLALTEEWRQTVHRLLALPWAIDEHGEKTAYRIGLDPAAYALWGQFAGMVETELRPGGQFEFMTDWAGKFPGQAIRLAGLLHAATVSDPHKVVIGPDTMRSALSVAAILAEHAKAAFGLMGSDPAQDCARAVLRWIMRDRVTTFTARDALRAVRGRFSTMEKVTAGLGVLEERAFIFEAPDEARRGKGPGRKPSMAYIVNPKTWEV